MVQTFQRDTQASKDEYAQTKKQIDEQFKKDQRRAKKAKEEAGWQALAFFEGSRDEGVKWRRGTEANWHAAIEDLHIKQETAEFVLKRCGKLAVATPGAPASTCSRRLAAADARDPAEPSRRKRGSACHRRRPRRPPEPAKPPTRTTVREHLAGRQPPLEPPPQDPHLTRASTRN